MFVRVVHIDGVVKPLIDHFRVQELLTPPAQSSFKSYEGLENNADLVARFILACAENFYQSDCSVYCEPQDSDELGHYDCGENGEKLCHLGYIDPASNCTEWVCPCGMGACFFPAPDSLLCVCPTGYRGDYCQYEGNTLPKPIISYDLWETSQLVQIKIYFLISLNKVHFRNATQGYIYCIQNMS